MTRFTGDPYFTHIKKKSSLIGSPGALGSPGPSRWSVFHRAVTRRGLLLAGAGAAVVAATPGEAGQTAPTSPPGAGGGAGVSAGRTGAAPAAPRTLTRVGTWAAAPTAVPAKRILILDDQTVRQVVHTSVGGDRPRVTLTNEYGTEPVRLGAARIAVRAGSGASCDSVPGTDRPLTFRGAAETVLAPGQVLVSDPVDMVVEAGADLVISLYLPGRVAVGTTSPRAKQWNLIVKGDATAESRPGSGKRVTRFLWLCGVSVQAAGNTAAIVTLGDSITIGSSTTDNANRRWPDLLAARLRAAGTPHGLLNVGLSGNRLLFGFEDPTGRADPRAFAGAAAVRRLQRDVLRQPGARHLITLIGVNDLAANPAVTSAQLIAGHRDLIRRARRAGLLVAGGTLLPFGEAPARYNNAANHAKRRKLNDWIRTSGEYDAVIDFDEAVRDPAQPKRMRLRYDSGDGLHPNDAGAAALAAAVPLELFT